MESIDAAFTKEEFELDCDNCGKRQPSTKGYQLHSLPPILTISLSRFVFSMQTL